MSQQRFRTTIVAGWIAAVAASLVARLTFGAGAPASTEGLAWMLAMVGPASVWWIVFRGAPPPTIAEVIRTTESATPTSSRSNARRS